MAKSPARRQGVKRTEDSAVRAVATARFNHLDWRDRQAAHQGHINRAATFATGKQYRRDRAGSRQARYDQHQP